MCRDSVLIGVLAVLSIGCSDSGDRSLERGDRLFAVGDIEGAVAEYKLAVRQRGDDPEVVARLGHAYAAQGDVDESYRYYEILLEQDSSQLYQVASDLNGLARQALEEGARDNMVRALQPLLSRSVGLVATDLQLELARRFWRDGDYPRALPLYLSALGETPDVDPIVYYETGRAYEEMRGCRRSLEFFDSYLGAADRRAPERASAEWHTGNCLFLVAEEDRAEGRPRAALEKLDRMIRLGVPQTRIDMAHFVRGELLLALGDRQAALAAYREVLRLNRTRTKPIVQRAEQRIRQIRFETP